MAIPSCIALVYSLMHVGASNVICACLIRRNTVYVPESSVFESRFTMDPSTQLAATICLSKQTPCFITPRSIYSLA
ncbi:hypothetical protein PR003_g6119 [Phytophthora rubi]|uniref:Secreted protein n=1 Tax=Phytophthora rubi TaxID=129364 RepID=A0A6A4FHM3_9STRA|nr:hypothetical protein PR002_g316 [Phytophthora rubi]KAE9348992.1 hypothetical protein PR003_g6119 [Phytophthora rubi]